MWIWKKLLVSDESAYGKNKKQAENTSLDIKLANFSMNKKSVNKFKNAHCMFIVIKDMEKSLEKFQPLLSKIKIIIG